MTGSEYMVECEYMVERGHLKIGVVPEQILKSKFAEFKNCGNSSKAVPCLYCVQYAYHNER